MIRSCFKICFVREALTPSSSKHQNCRQKQSRMISAKISKFVLFLTIVTDNFMNEGNSIPFPVLFNPFKHHRSFVLETLKTQDMDRITLLLEAVCNNYIDIYTGDLTPRDIGHEIIGILETRLLLQKPDFDRTIRNGYLQVKLIDQSEWIIRKSDDPERYVHIHPARTGAFTVRFKGSSLKTVYMLKTRTGQQNDSPSLEEVNRVRSEVSLSPVKKLEHGKGILRCHEKFVEQT